MSARPPVTAIAAADLDDGIARAGSLPWRLPSDLKRFRRLTMGDGRNAVLMGRLTFTAPEVASRPLPKRLNVVLSRQPAPADLAPGVVWAPTWEDALAACEGCEAIWIVGGGEIYAQAFALDLVDAVELTRVHARFGCDRHWPGLPEGRFTQVSAESREDGGLTVTDERWERRRDP
jgi:dihydrofolate reductase